MLDSGKPVRYCEPFKLLHPDLATEVFGFLERAHVGSSLLASRALHDVIFQLKQRLPVHQLRCTFQDITAGPERGFFWLKIRHRQRDLSYTDVRRLKIPSTAGAGDDCALIRNYLSNSHLTDLEPPKADDFPFTIKMLASLAACNISVGRVELRAGAERLYDYRSLDAIFGGLRMNELDLTCYERCFVEFVNTADFFQMSKVQGLRKLKLTLTEPWIFDDEPRGRTESKSPLWVSAIRLLRNCYYQVNYQTDRHLRSIERRMVQICEEFERGEITDTVHHFHFNTPKEVTYAFSRNNLVASGMKVEGESKWDPVKYFEWDVYRFRNASTSEYLTILVSQGPAFGGPSRTSISNAYTCTK
ncbi:hypothetical protein AAVH_20156 [Aphelenchoides avenae]|nr:hypothetical protein AAVH_20156 [Aphelenchus avenae]